jgi:hypothetical protein
VPATGGALWTARGRLPGHARVEESAPAGNATPPAVSAASKRHGWVVLHDLTLPGCRANLDHIAIGAPGVFVIDSPQNAS